MKEFMFLVLGAFIGFAMGMNTFIGYHKSHHHWVGKMNYAIATQDVEIDTHFFIPDSIKRKIESRYAKRAKEFGYKPYGEIND